MLLVYLVLVLVPSLVIGRKLLNPMGFLFLVICLEVKENLTTVLRVRVGKPERGSMEALIAATLLNTLCHLDDCDQFCYQFL